MLLKSALAVAIGLLGGAQAESALTQSPRDLTPQAWSGPVPADIRVLEDAWRFQSRALQHERRGVSLAVEVDIDAERLRRFDPPRPATTEGRITPQVTASWSPVADRIARETARLAELEVDLIEAWNEVILAPLANAVRRERLTSDLLEAERELTALENGAPQAGRDAVAAWQLDLASARLDAQQARLGLATLPPDLPAERRVALPLPPAVQVTTLRSYRADRHRLVARVLRAERRYRDETVGGWLVGWGHAGSDGRLETEVGFDAGRPSVTAGASVVGSDRERSWVGLRGSVAFSLDGRRRLDERAAARADLARFDAREAELRQDAQALDLEQARLSLEDWRIAEARFRHARSDGANNAGQLEDRARRAWLRHVRDTQRAWDAVEQVVVLP